MKNINFTFILIFLSHIPCVTFANIGNGFYPVSDIPAELLKDAHSVIRHEHTTFEVKSLDKVAVHYQKVVTILKESSPYKDVLVFYDKSFHKVKMGEVEIYDERGVLLRKIKGKNLTDHSSNQGAGFDSGRFLHANASNTKYPYTIAYEYDMDISMTMFYRDWNIVSRYEVSVEHSEYSIKLPQDKQLRYRPKNIDITPNVSTEKAAQVYHFEAKNLPAFREEPMSPLEEHLFPAVIFAPDEFEVADHKGDMSTWENLSRFSYDLNKNRDILSAEMQQTVRGLVANVTSKEEKIKILYQYLQENMRYVSVQLGVGGWQTFDAKYVEHNKFGDCKALSNFMKSMLKAANIQAYSALIRNGREARDQMADFSSSDFNHVVLYIPNTGEINWLECTSADLPAGIIGQSNEDRYALIIKPKGGQLQRTPKSTKDDNSLISKLTLKLNNDGAAQIVAEQTASAHQEGIYRYYAFNESTEEQEKMLRNILTVPNFNMNDFAILPDKDHYQTKIKLDLTIPKYASKAGKRLFFTPNSINKTKRVPRDIKDRKYPIENRSAFVDEDIATIELPTDYQVESIPQKEVLIETDFGKYEMTLEQKDRQLIYKRHMERKVFQFPKERYEEYRTFMKAVAKADKMKVVLVRSVP